MKTTQEKLKEVEVLLREIYKENDGPRLIAEITYQFPNPRRVWNEASRGYSVRQSGWGIPATAAVS